MRLLDLSYFEHIFRPLKKRLVGLVDGHGNVGDKLIYSATRQLLNEFGINWIPQKITDNDKVDVYLLFGGGNFGSIYQNEIKIRQSFLQRGIPCILLPQSMMSYEQGLYEKIYVREKYSLKYRPEAILAPDLALGYNNILEINPLHEEGIFLRTGPEKQVNGSTNNGDPANMSKTPIEYLTLAGLYKNIITDRLHFAICGLIMGRNVTLLPNSYHKNLGMWECWLNNLGCQWKNSL